MAGRIGFELDFGGPGAGRERRADGTQHRLLILGDFAGRGRRETVSTPEPASLRPLNVDIDSFDATLARCEPAVRLGSGVTGGAELALAFRSLDDFHPDRLYRSVEAFRPLRESRVRLQDPARFHSEAAALLQPLTGLPAERAPRAQTPGGLVDGLVARLVQPHIVRGADPSLATYLAALDATASELMRRILRDPGFQALEGLWRGLRRLVENLELGDEIAISVLDVAKEELAAGTIETEGRSPQFAALHRLLGTRSVDRPEQPAWSLLAACYSFAADPHDIALLSDLGATAAETGVPMLASASPSLMGCERLDERSDPREWRIADPSIADQWSALRRSPVARWIGLALPRVLVRLPYGSGTDATESFDFAEIVGAGEHESFLWGHPAFACLEAIVPGLLGDDPTTAGPLEVTDLPACVIEVDGEKRLKPAAEHVLSLKTGEAMQQLGFIPLLSYRDRNAVRLLRLQSIAEPVMPLPGLG